MLVDVQEPREDISCTTGVTARRHFQSTWAGTEHDGKEAGRWDERLTSISLLLHQRQLQYMLLGNLVHTVALRTPVVCNSMHRLAQECFLQRWLGGLFGRASWRGSHCTYTRPLKRKRWGKALNYNWSLFQQQCDLSSRKANKTRHERLSFYPLLATLADPIIPFLFFEISTEGMLIQLSLRRSISRLDYFLCALVLFTPHSANSRAQAQFLQCKAKWAETTAI